MQMRYYLQIAAAIMLLVFILTTYMSKNSKENFEDETKSVIGKLKDTIDNILGREAVNDPDEVLDDDDDDALYGSL